MRVDIYHDTVCPWCRIGKAHFKQALAEWDGEPVEVHYKTFFLNPDVPEEGHDFAAYMSEKGGGQVPLEQWFARPREMGAQAGLEFNFERITRAPNSIKSHQLIALATEAGRETVIDALYDAYFREGRDIGDQEVLLEIAESCGMERKQTQAALEAGEKRAQILAEYDQARNLGVTGVPFFVFNQTSGFSGAQPPEVFSEVFQKVAGGP
jgi:predicted DsbA family dithiol-disulfide isomerase